MPCMTARCTYCSLFYHRLLCLVMHCMTSDPISFTVISLLSLKEYSVCTCRHRGDCSVHIEPRSTLTYFFKICTVFQQAKYQCTVQKQNEIFLYTANNAIFFTLFGDADKRQIHSKLKLAKLNFHPPPTSPLYPAAPIQSRLLIIWGSLYDAHPPSSSTHLHCMCSLTYCKVWGGGIVH
jgi:hypothetical protein